jgi:2-iminobutanoate/2-iminopropanoate deaminase
VVVSTSARRHLFSRELFQSTAPFSHVVVNGDLAFISGIIGQRRDSGQLVSSDAGEQAKAMFENLTTLIAEAGLALRDVLRTTLYLVDYADFAALNDAYTAYLAPPFPARTTLQVAGLPLGARVQIDAIVAVSGS